MLGVKIPWMRDMMEKLRSTGEGTEYGVYYGFSDNHSLLVELRHEARSREWPGRLRTRLFPDFSDFRADLDAASKKVNNRHKPCDAEGQQIHHRHAESNRNRSKDH